MSADEDEVDMRDPPEAALSLERAQHVNNFKT